MSAEASHLLVEKADGVMTLTMNRPEARNALSPQMLVKLAENGPLAVRKIKEGVLRTSGLPLDHALQIENEVSAAVMASKEAREGPRAFKEKRKPRFIGE
jgi:enoyl-CoA hydratase/carnithine racemase